MCLPGVHVTIPYVRAVPTQRQHSTVQVEILRELHHTVYNDSSLSVSPAMSSLNSVFKAQCTCTIGELKQQGLIEPSNSPWSFPVILVKKKDGSLCFCVDYRQLNHVTRKVSYPLAWVDDALEALADMKWFSTLDLQSGCWGVKLDKMSQEKIAFFLLGAVSGSSRSCRLVYAMPQPHSRSSCSKYWQDCPGK